MKIHALLFLCTILFSFSLTGQEKGEQAALLVIDMQDEFTRYTLDEASASELINNVNTAIAALRPLDVIFVKADIRVLTISLKGIRAEPAEHTALDGRLDRREGDLVLEKKESSALTLEQLNDYLEKNRIRHLYIAGLFLGQCLTNTALHAVEEGYTVTMVREAVTAKKRKKSEKFLEQLKAQGVQVRSISEL